MLLLRGPTPRKDISRNWELLLLKLAGRNLHLTLSGTCEGAGDPAATSDCFMQNVLTLQE